MIFFSFHIFCLLASVHLAAEEIVIKSKSSQKYLFFNILRLCYSNLL